MTRWRALAGRWREALYVVVALAVVYVGMALIRGTPAVRPVTGHELYGPPLGAQRGAPEVKSSSSILVDADSGQILYEKNAHQRRLPASVTKLMTLELIMDALQDGRVSLGDTVVISGHAEGYGGAEMYLARGERMKLEDILYGIAMFSANDGSVALAEHIAGSEEAFIQMMNGRARELGMKDSHFENPHGLPGYKEHYMSAYDVAILTRHLVNRHPELLKYASTWEHWVRKGTKAELWMTNFNRGIVEYEGMDGLKTGFTEEAGFNLSATAARGGRRMIAVVMGAPEPKQRNAEIYRLLDYGFNGFDTVRVAEREKPVGSIKVHKGVVRQVAAVPAETVALTVPKGQKEKVASKAVLGGPLTAPVARGQQVGEISVARDGQEVKRIPLVAAGEVPRANPALLAGRYWRSLWLPTFD